MGFRVLAAAKSDNRSNTTAAFWSRRQLHIDMKERGGHYSESKTVYKPLLVKIDRQVKKNANLNCSRQVITKIAPHLLKTMQGINPNNS
jgi:hypothetical protein